MPFPKIQNPKPKLSLAEKLTLKIEEPFVQNIEKKEEKQPSYRNSRVISGSKHPNRRLSSSSLKENQSSRNVFKNRKLSSHEKEIQFTPKLDQNDLKLQHKSNLKLNKCIKSSNFSSGTTKHEEPTDTATKFRQKSKTLLVHFENRTDRKSSHTNSTSSHQISQETLKIVQNLFPLKEQNSVNKIRSVERLVEKQNQFQFLNYQNTHVDMTQSEGPLRVENYQKVSEGHKNFNRKASIQTFSLQSSLFSIKIQPQNHRISQKKRMMVKSFIEDEDFEWKYQKFKEYTQKYSEYEVKLKQNFAMLQLLTENIELLKQRIIPYRDYTALKEIIEIVKAPLTKKQQKAIDIKMSLAQWKKKFFSNIRKVREKITSSWQQRSQRLRFRLEDNEELSQKTFNIINQASKKETVTLSQDNIIKIKNYSQTILLNQKQMIDDVQIFEANNENFLQKIDLLEEEWTRAFDIFNFTLEKCAKKSITLSQTIEKFYGMCSTAAFLTKGLEADKLKDQKVLQNEDCDICHWNKIKIQKIIEQNSLAKDHLVALKHLVVQ